MKIHSFLGAALGVLLLTGTATAAKIKYVATLGGDQQVPPVTTTATGSATFEYDEDTKTLTGEITYSGVTPTLVHIHEEACGKNGAPMGIDFCGDPCDPADLASPLQVPDGTTLDQTEADALAAGKLYVNIHSADHANGEIRGQLFKEGSTDKCPADATDGGTPKGGADAGTSSGGTSGGTTSSSSGGTSGSTNDAGTAKSSSGSATPGSTDEKSGCSTTGSGSAPGSGVAIALGVAMTIGAISRGRRKS
jgi:hypothetical protein